MLPVLKEDCAGYSTIARFTREFRVFKTIKTIKQEQKVKVFDDFDFRIKDVVDEEPFLSVRQIATLTGIPKSTVFERLTEKLGYILKHLKRVPHLLSEEQKRNRVIIANDLLKIIEKAEHAKVGNIL